MRRRHRSPRSLALEISLGFFLLCWCQESALLLEEEKEKEKTSFAYSDKFLQSRSAGGCGDVACEGLDASDGLDRNKIDTHNRRCYGAVLRSHLKPTARRRTEVNDTPTVLLKETKTLTELKKFEGTTGSVALLFRQVIELIKPLLPLLLSLF